MRPIRFAILALTAALSIGATKPAAPAPRGNWLTTVAVSPNGSHLLGNPAAPVKLVEYVSYTCSHCAHFQREAEMPLQISYVQPGKVQVEVRHLVRDPIDMTVAMLTNCGTPARFYLNHSLFLRNQDNWMARVNSASEAQRARWNNGDTVARMRAIAGDLGFYGMMAQRGYDRQTLERCLADPAMTKRLVAQTTRAQTDGVEGTPSFMINGVLLTATHDWQSLNTQLQARF
ncbi:thioredoxin domain-containing protein [Novosphingobium sp. PS1R-30]|uniref:Thioredoxin domain-containing protein n=1 Tax=Novosphingobium anseongense TaxID=3133436 RepID=A0ABU8S058_9SPHN|nr:MAG: protein-disulfide isomerase [Novosphingobium sp.]